MGVNQSARIGHPRKALTYRGMEPTLGIETRSLLITNQLLYQLSYVGMVEDRRSPTAEPFFLARSSSTHRCAVSTDGQGDAHDITAAGRQRDAESGLRDGLVTIFVVGSTAAVTTIKFEPGEVADLNGLFDRLAPRTAEYSHHQRWGDDNGSSRRAGRPGRTVVHHSVRRWRADARHLAADHADRVRHQRAAPRNGGASGRRV